MERQAKDGTIYKMVGQDEWAPVTRAAKDGTVYKKVGADDWAPMQTQTMKSPAKEAAPISKTTSAARGVAQGATLGFADEIAGGTEALWEKAKGNPTEFGKLYQKFRDESRANFSAAKEANPGSFLAGELGGGLATAFVPGVGIARGAQASGIVGRAMAAGAAAGTGYSEANNVKDLAIDAGVGGTIGALAASAAPALGRAGAVTGKKARDVAERFAARALGAERGTVKKLGGDKVREIGRFALDEKILSPLASTDDMIARNQALKERGAGKMNEVYREIDEAGASTFNPLETAAKVDDKIGGFYRSPINRGETNQLENTLEAILMRGDKNIPLAEAQKLKQELGKVANWKNTLNITDKEKMARDAYGVVSSAIDEATEKGAKAVGREGLQESLSAGKALYGNAKGAEELLSNKLAREEGNKLLGLTDWGILGVGTPAAVVSGGSTVVPTLAAVGAKKALERFGSQNAALALDKASKALAKTPSIAESAGRRSGFVAQASGRPGRPAAASVAEEDSPPSPKPTKGPTKWANDGAERLKKAGADSAAIEELMKTKKGRELLMEASDASPESKRMKSILSRIKTASAEGGQ